MLGYCKYVSYTVKTRLGRVESEDPVYQYSIYEVELKPD